MRSACAFLLLTLLSGGAALGQARPAKPAGSKGGTLQVQSSVVGDYVQMVVSGAADLPDGTVLQIQFDVIEQGRKLADLGWLMLVEVKEGRFEARRNCARDLFRPATYAIEATVRADQRETVAGQLTKQQKAFRATGSLANETQQPGMELAIEACRPIVTALRAMAGASGDLAKHAAAATEGKLAKPAWTAAKGKSGIMNALGDLDKALARKEVPLYFPSASSIAALAARVRASVAACDAAAEGKAGTDAKASPDPAAFPSDEEVTRVLRPLYLDGIEMFTSAMDEIILIYNPSMPPEKREQGRALIELYAKAWPAYKGLAWKGTYPIQFLLLDDLCKDVKALTSGPAGAGPAPDSGKKGSAAKGASPGKVQDPMNATLKRLRDMLQNFRGTLAIEKAKK